MYPVPFKMSLKRLDIIPDEAIMVGDWPEKDVVGASQVGIKTILTSYGDTYNVKSSGADWEVDDINKVLHIIDELNSV